MHTHTHTIDIYLYTYSAGGETGGRYQQVVCDVPGGPLKGLENQLAMAVQ